MTQAPSAPRPTKNPLLRPPEKPKETMPLGKTPTHGMLGLSSSQFPEPTQMTSPEFFLAEWTAATLDPAWLHRLHMEALHRHGIDACHKIQEFISARNRKLAHVGRSIVSQMETRARTMAIQRDKMQPAAK